MLDRAIHAMLHPVQRTSFPAPEPPPTIFRECPTRECFQMIAWTRQKDGAYRPARCFTCGPR